MNDVWQFVIYDAFGKLVAEYGGTVPQDEGGVKYYLQDWQGSVRAGLNAAGFVKSRTDHQAFGEDITSGVGLRTTAQGFGAPQANRQGYGLTEKDSTGLNHTWFRKNENRAGRWTSPDPFGESAAPEFPQSWNRFTYVENEPTNYVDPDGLFIVVPGYCPPEFSCGGITTISFSFNIFDIVDIGAFDFPGGIATTRSSTNDSAFSDNPRAAKGILEKLKEVLKQLRTNPLMLLKCSQAILAVGKAILSCYDRPDRNCVADVIVAVEPLASCLEEAGFGVTAKLLRKLADLVDVVLENPTIGQPPILGPGSGGSRGTPPTFHKPKKSPKRIGERGGRTGRTPRLPPKRFA